MSYECGHCKRKFKTEKHLIKHNYVPSAGDFLGEGYYCNLCESFCHPVLAQILCDNKYLMRKQDKENKKIMNYWDKIHIINTKKILIAQKKERVPKKYWLTNSLLYKMGYYHE